MTFHSSAAAFGFVLALGAGTAVQAATPAPAAAQAAQALKKTDVVTGSGKAAAPGATVSVHYTGWLYAPKAARQHGARFDSSEAGRLSRSSWVRARSSRVGTRGWWA